MNGTFSVASISDSGISAGGYAWNVYWCDELNQCRFNSQNFTLTVESAADNTKPSNITNINPANNTQN